MPSIVEVGRGGSKFKCVLSSGGCEGREVERRGREVRQSSTTNFGRSKMCVISCKSPSGLTVHYRLFARIKDMSSAA